MICLLITIIFSVIGTKQFEQSYFINEKNLARLDSTFLHLASAHLKIVLVLTPVMFRLGLSSAPVIANIIAILSLFLEMYDIFIEMPFTCYEKLINSVISVSFFLTASILALFYESFQIIGDKTFLCLLLILCPLFSRLAMTIMRNKFFDIINNYYFIRKASSA